MNLQVQATIQRSMDFKEAIHNAASQVHYLSRRGLISVEEKGAVATALEALSELAASVERRTHNLEFDGTYKTNPSLPLDAAEVLRDFKETVEGQQ